MSNLFSQINITFLKKKETGPYWNYLLKLFIGVIYWNLIAEWLILYLSTQGWRSSPIFHWGSEKY